MNPSLSNRGDCKTALATSVLLNSSSSPNRIIQNWCQLMNILVYKRIYYKVFKHEMWESVPNDQMRKVDEVLEEEDKEKDKKEVNREEEK